MIVTVNFLSAIIKKNLPSFSVNVLFMTRHWNKSFLNKRKKVQILQLVDEYENFWISKPESGKDFSVRETRRDERRKKGHEEENRGKKKV